MSTCLGTGTLEEAFVVRVVAFRLHPLAIYVGIRIRVPASGLAVPVGDLVHGFNRHADYRANLFFLDASTHLYHTGGQSVRLTRFRFRLYISPSNRGHNPLLC